MAHSTMQGDQLKLGGGEERVKMVTYIRLDVTPWPLYITRIHTTPSYIIASFLLSSPILSSSGDLFTIYRATLIRSVASLIGRRGR